MKKYLPVAEEQALRMHKTENRRIMSSESIRAMSA